MKFWLSPAKRQGVIWNLNRNHIPLPPLEMDPRETTVLNSVSYDEKCIYFKHKVVRGEFFCNTFIGSCLKCKL